MSLGILASLSTHMQSRAGLELPIYSVPGGAEAIAFLNGDPPYQDRLRYPLPALVLLDIQMPKVDGFEVLRWIRQQPSFANLPVVMLTGSKTNTVAETARLLGANSFMVKPLTVRMLQNCLTPLAKRLPLRHREPTLGSVHQRRLFSPRKLLLLIIPVRPSF